MSQTIAVKDYKDLLHIKERYISKKEKYPYTILICSGASCISSNCLNVKKALEAELEKAGLSDKVLLKQTGCVGFCDVGPTMIIEPDGVFYCKLSPENMESVVQRHLLGKEIVEELCYLDKKTGKRVPQIRDIDFFKDQLKIVFAKCGIIDYSDIEEYIATEGYKAIYKVLTEMTPDDVIEELSKSGLRGRGGGGFPTANKWRLAKQAKGDQKYVICNADEGDPGAFMDRSLLEGDPHAVIEGMMIAGYAIGASKCIVYVRAEYPLAVERLTDAIEKARKYGLLGENIFNTGFDYDIEIRIGAGAFVCGEETALMNSVEGKRGEPRQKPPYPAEAGLFGKPTIINNVETFGNIASIFIKGSDWFASVGTEKSNGTKVFALAGDISNTGIVEVPIGTPLRKIVEDIGGGIPDNKAFKAAQIGGPSGGCIPAKLFDIPLDYNNLIEIGAMMGSGGLIVLDENTCMVDIAKFFLEFTVDESCGKCTPCRVGTRRLYELLEKITQGKGTPEDIDKLEELCYHIKGNSLCGLGQSAPNPVLSTLKFFRDEYVAHVQEKHCPAGVCKALLSYEIIEDKCTGCTLCARVCPVGCISGTVKNPHKINKDICIKCGACYEKCRFSAIVRK